MANTLSVTYTGTDSVYAIIRKTSNGTVWNGSSFVAWADGNIGDYDIPLSSQGGDLYAANFPSSITVNIEYRVIYYEQTGATPSTSDLLLNSEEGYWDGTQLVKNLSTAAIATSTTTYDDLTLLYASSDDVIAILPRQITRPLLQRNSTSGSPAVTVADIEGYIRRAQTEIDGKLTHLYVVPLSRIKSVDGRTQAQTTSYIYPSPIPYICQRFAAALIYNERFTGDSSDVDGSVYGKQYWQEGMNALENILRGTTTLIGQRHKGWRYGRDESRNIYVLPQFNERVKNTNG